MSTAPKKPHPHANIIKAWAEGAEIEFLPLGGVWQPCPNPEWMKTGMYRIKPEPAAPVYPETKMKDEDFLIATPNIMGKTHKLSEVEPFILHSFRKLANFAIRRAIDDGQVVVPGSVVNAEFDPDFQEVKAGENYRWMGHTAREWQELYEKAKEAHRREVAQVSSKYSIEVHEAAASVKAAQEKIAAVQSELSIYKLTEMQRNYQREAEKYDAADLIAERMKRAERALLNAGFVDNGAQEWKPPLNKAAVKLIDLGYQSINGEWKQIHPEFSPTHPIKPGETVYHESKVWQAVDKRDLALARAEELMAERDEQADRLVKQLAHAERVLKANGFTYSPDEGWSIHSGWRGQVMEEKQDRITYLEGELTAARRACEQYKAIVHRVGRAVAMHLNRSDITENQIAAIVLLERAK